MVRHLTPPVLKIVIGCILFVYGTAGNLVSARAQSPERPIIETARPLGNMGKLHKNSRDEPFQSAAERFDQRAQPEPMHFGGFLAFPSLTLSQKYTDNLYADEREEGDFITQINPSLYVIKEFGRHQADFSLEGDIRQHWRYQDENQMNVRAKIGAKLEARHDIHIPLELNFTSAHEDREQAFARTPTKEPVTYENFGAATGISFTPGRLGLHLLGRYADISFDNGEDRQTGAAILRDRDDRQRYEGTLRATYDIGPNHTPFVEVTGGRTAYTRNEALDSTNIEALAGWETDYKGLLKARIAGGIGQRDYEDDALEDITSTRAQARLDWNLTKVATLNLSYDRKLLEDNEAVTGALTQSARAGLDYELARNILLTTFVEFGWLNFEDSARRDKIVGSGFSLRYDFNPYHSVAAEYDHSNRESTSPGIDYGRNTYMIRYKMKF